VTEGSAAQQLEPGDRRCFHCGAPQPDPEVERCGECKLRLRLAPVPVERGPAGWCRQHPEAPITGVCSHCGAFTCVQCDVAVRGVRLCQRCRDDLAERLTTPVPWEERRSIGRWQGWWRTTSDITAHPLQFFDRMEPSTDLGSALIYGGIGATLTASWQILFGLLYVVIGIVIAGVAVFAPSGHPQSGPNPALLGMGVISGMGLAMMVLAPVFTLLGYVVMACLQHLSLRIVGAGKEHGLTATLKIALYALGTGWVGLMPYMGQWMHPFWWTGLMVVGAARVHRCSTTRALAVLIPVLLVCIAPMVAYIMFLFVMIIAGILA